ncbi:MAG TPA: hypothetical protein DCS04_02995 [Ruminococcaceae bacterium]|nr:hypothetical protein [Oscillospiraceae bacterium]
MKRIVFFSHGLSANGIETFLVNVLKKIDRTKYDITVIIAIDEGVYCLHEKTVTDLGIRVIHAGDLDAVKKKFEYIKNVKRILSKERFDIAHSNMDLLNGVTLTIAKKCGIPVRICHAHTSKSQYSPTGRFAGAKKLFQKKYSGIMRFLINRASTERLACSDVAAEYFYKNRFAKLIYNGIDVDGYKEMKKLNRSEYLKSIADFLNIDKVISSVGRLIPVKNPAFAIDIIAELAKLRTDFKYIWVGAGELENEVKNKAKQLGVSDKVVFTGVRTDVKEILSCCDCFLMPSLFEGLPFSLIEAQAAGLHCVVSDVVTREADVGLIEYFPLEKGAQKWAELIDKTLDRPKESADERLNLFDIKHTVKQLEEIYDR